MIELIVLQTNRKFVPSMWGIIPVWFYPWVNAPCYPGVGVYSDRCIRISVSNKIIFFYTLIQYLRVKCSFLFLETYLRGIFPFFSSHDGKNKSAWSQSTGIKVMGSVFIAYLLHMVTWKRGKFLKGCQWQRHAMGCMTKLGKIWQMYILFPYGP